MQIDQGDPSFLLLIKHQLLSDGKVKKIDALNTCPIFVPRKRK